MQQEHARTTRSAKSREEERKEEGESPLTPTTLPAQSRRGEGARKKGGFRPPLPRLRGRGWGEGILAAEREPLTEVGSDASDGRLRGDSGGSATGGFSAECRSGRFPGSEIVIQLGTRAKTERESRAQ